MLTGLVRLPLPATSRLETREAIKAKTGFTDGWLMTISPPSRRSDVRRLSDAAEIVGGGEKLSKILRWAANNFAGEQLQGLQAGLAGPNSELTLRGLAAAYDQANPVVAEPARAAEAVTPGGRCSPGAPRI